MGIYFDRGGLIYAGKFTLFAGIIIIAGVSMVRELIITTATPFIPPQGAAEDNSSGILEETTFYINLPTEKPVFLSAGDVTKKKETLIWEKKDFLYVDLSQMSLETYEGGAWRKSFKIVSRGTKGSFFETPSGFYKIQEKSVNHVSKLEGIRFPWSIYLYGNYLIHGSPILKSGRRAEENFDGGGIRLKDNDAKELFSSAKEGTAVLIFNELPGTPNFSYFRRTSLPHRVPETTAASALAIDLESGKALFEKNKSDVYPIASITKLVTALIATETIRDEKVLTATKEALETYGDSAGLALGEEIKSRDLLYALLLSSSNDAAEIYKLAVENFMELMNEKSKTLGLTSTFFADPSGLDRENVSSAEDTYKLLKYLNESAPHIFEVSRIPSYSYQSENKKWRHVWRNINWPSNDKRFVGGKAGFTDDSLQTMAGIYNVRVSEYGGRKIAIIVLGSRNRIADVQAIINYIENEFIFGAAPVQTKPALRYGAALYETLR